MPTTPKQNTFEEESDWSDPDIELCEPESDSEQSQKSEKEADHRDSSQER